MADWKNILIFPADVGREGLALALAVPAERRHEELAGGNDGDDPGDNVGDVLAGEDEVGPGKEDEGPADHDLIDERIEHPADAGLHAQSPGKVAVEDVGQPGEDEDGDGQIEDPGGIHAGPALGEQDEEPAGQAQSGQRQVVRRDQGCYGFQVHIRPSRRGRPVRMGLHQVRRSFDPVPPLNRSLATRRIVPPVVSRG